MSLIEESLRRQNDPTLSKVPAPAKPGAKAEASTQTPPAHPWAPTATKQVTLGRSAASPSGRRTWLLASAAAALVLWAVVHSMPKERASFPPHATTSSGSPGAAKSAARAKPSSISAATNSLKRSIGMQKSSSHSRLVLNGTAVGGGASYAVINGEILAEGERIQGNTLVAIRKEEVDLRQGNGRSFTLQLQQ